MRSTTIVSSGPPENRIDIVILGDGYTASELGTLFREHAWGLVNYLFEGGRMVEPFDRYASFFNVHLIEVASAQSGADDPARGIEVETAFDASYAFAGGPQRLLYVNSAKVSTAIVETLVGTGIEVDIGFVSVNSQVYGGGGGTYAVFAGGDGKAREIALHELAHAYVDLGDEYPAATGPYAGPEPAFANLTTDPSGAKWAEWIGYPDPDLGPIGVHEGASSGTEGIYRPSQTSKMKQLGKPFDAVAREVFVREFHQDVDPLDAWAFEQAEETVTDPGTLWVTPIDASLIETRWEVNGRPAGMGAELALSPLAAGTYEVTAIAEDPTDWVRGDRSALGQSVRWTVEITEGTAGEPVARPDTIAAESGAAVLIDPLADNGAGPDAGVGLALAGIDVPEAGRAAVLEDGRVLYRSEPGFSGADRFEYRLDDAGGTEVSGLAEVLVSAPGDGPSLAEAQAVGYLYEAAFDRRPDAAGLDHWIAARAEGMSEHALAGTFLASEEASAKLAASDDPDESFVTALYRNVLGRGPDPEGLTFWTGELAAGSADRADLLLDFALGWENAIGAPWIATLAKGEDGAWLLA